MGPAVGRVTPCSYSTPVDARHRRLPREDGHGQERSLSGQVEATVQPRDPWIDDRNSCTTGFLSAFPPGRLLPSPPARRDATYTLVGKRRIGNGWKLAGSSSRRSEPRTTRVRSCSCARVTVVLDKPTRDGDTAAPPADECAGQARPWRVMADSYRRRRTIENAFAEMEKGAQRRDQLRWGYPEQRRQLLYGLGGVECPVHGQGWRLRSCTVRRRSRSSPASHSADEIQMSTRDE